MPSRKGHRSVTMKDVAREANVSYQTVSRAINGYNDIGAKTSQRVLEIARRLDYRPNRLAGSLRSSRSKVIGLIVSDIENTFFAEVVSGVEAEATNRDYSVFIANSGEDIERERQAVISLFERRIDGLIIAPAEGDHKYLKKELPNKFPIVAVNRLIELPGCGAVLTENEEGARRAVDYLVGRGHKKIGLIVASNGLTTSQERLLGFRHAMLAAKLPVRQEWLAVGGEVRPEGARLAAMRIFGRSDHPTAMLTSSHRILEGLLLALKALGLRHGRDVDVVSFDLVPWAAIVDPPITIIAQPTQQIGKEAVRKLVGMIAGDVGPRVMRLPTRLLTHSDPEFSVLGQDEAVEESRRKWTGPRGETTTRPRPAGGAPSCLKVRIESGAPAEGDVSKGRK